MYSPICAVAHSHSHASALLETVETGERGDGRIAAYQKLNGRLVAQILTATYEAYRHAHTRHRQYLGLSPADSPDVGANAMVLIEQAYDR
ncbi:hypothetical protein GCM10009855_21140 [Gordonia cholesterolivorans]|uniref:Uncharacterized protein n=1 Tax=Gordonia cholesterolivorans TaxID=559625 RepID=A0ABP5UK47_9ACTN